MKYNKYKLIVDIYNKHLFTFILTLVDFSLVNFIVRRCSDWFIFPPKSWGRNATFNGIVAGFPSFLPSPQSPLPSPRPKKACRLKCALITQNCTVNCTALSTLIALLSANQNCEMLSCILFQSKQSSKDNKPQELLCFGVYIYIYYICIQNFLLVCNHHYYRDLKFCANNKNSKTNTPISS